MTRRNRESVTLISMPFGPHLQPSIGLSLLQAGLRQRGILARIHYFALRFAEILGIRLYNTLADFGTATGRELAGEWLFREALFGEDSEHVEQYVEQILRQRGGWSRNAEKRPLPESMIRKILAARRKIPAFLNECADEIAAVQPDVVGFTSVFQQQVASLALAKELKRRLPRTVIVFGGANCEDVMGAETVRQFPFVDAAVSGEGDLVFPELVQRVLAGASIDGLPGVRTQSGIASDFARGTFTSAPMVRDMDVLPVPDYSDYFEQFERSRFAKTYIPNVMFESSRGCWWGERMHCTFCGLNGGSMRFRSKSAPRALAELRALAHAYPGAFMHVTDNIVDMKYFGDLLPALSGMKLNVDLFYETKSNLKKQQLRALRAAGSTRIQPGIESLSDSVLRLMRKGVTALQNIQLLKWSKELGIEPVWNLLWGFPGEDAAAYEEMALIIPKLRHLPKPGGIGGLRLDRFSPNFNDAAIHGFVNVRPLAPYRYVYPFGEDVVANLAYYFDYDYREPQAIATYVPPLLRALRSWQRAGRDEELLMFDNGRLLSVWDLRKGAVRPLPTLAGLDRFLYLGCDAVNDPRALAASAVAAGFENATEELARARLGLFVDCGIMLRDGNRHLALAIRVGEYQPSREVLAQLKAAAKWARRPRPVPRSQTPPGTHDTTTGPPALAQV